MTRLDDDEDYLERARERMLDAAERRRNQRVRALLIGLVLPIVLLVLLLILAGTSRSAQAATFKCKGFSFIYTELECEQPLPPATAGATFCQAARPIYWSANDTRATKDAVDAHNRVWKKLCRKGA